MTDVQLYGLATLIMTGIFALYSMFVSIPASKQGTETPTIRFIWRLMAGIIVVMAILGPTFLDVFELA